MKEFVLASKNAHKAIEIEQILGEGIKVITQNKTVAADIDVVEDGQTFEENAIKKAEAIMKITNRPTIADDSGLCVDYLGGAPGIYSARYAGENASDKDRIEKLLKALDGVEEKGRGAKFVCAVALAVPGEETKTFRGECHGRITDEPKGENGFGYDPVFFVEEFGKTLAEIGLEAKNKISHRFGALKLLSEYLNKR